METALNRYGLPHLWIDVVSQYPTHDEHFRDTSPLGSNIPIGQIAPREGMSNGNLTITKITDKSLVCRTREGGRQITKHFTIDVDEARKWGWEGNVVARGILAGFATAKFYDDCERDYGIARPLLLDHSVFRVDEWLRGDYGVLPLYSVDGAEPVAIEAAVKLLGIP